MSIKCMPKLIGDDKMAAIDQGKLNSMCSTINSEASSYVSNVNTSVRDLVDTFNQQWVSVSSQQLANEIGECLNSLADNITKTFSNKNEAIRMSVQNFNSVEQENVSYAGFSFGKPNVTLTLNKQLPNGKVGVSDTANLDTINTPMTTMVNKINSVLDSIKTAVNRADAFDNEEQTALTSSVEKIKISFDNAMNEIKNSLSSRMSSEISTRDNLKRTNVSNLQG